MHPHECVHMNKWQQTIFAVQCEHFLKRVRSPASNQWMQGSRVQLLLDCNATRLKKHLHAFATWTVRTFRLQLHMCIRNEWYYGNIIFCGRLSSLMRALRSFSAFQIAFCRLKCTLRYAFNADPLQWISSCLHYQPPKYDVCWIAMIVVVQLMTLNWKIMFKMRWNFAETSKHVTPNKNGLETFVKLKILILIVIEYLQSELVQPILVII